MGRSLVGPRMVCLVGTLTQQKAAPDANPDMVLSEQPDFKKQGTALWQLVESGDRIALLSPRHHPEVERAELEFVLLGGC